MNITGRFGISGSVPVWRYGNYLFGDDETFYSFVSSIEYFGFETDGMTKLEGSKVQNINFDASKSWTGECIKKISGIIVLIFLHCISFSYGFTIP